MNADVRQLHTEVMAAEGQSRSLGVPGLSVVSFQQTLLQAGCAAGLVTEHF